MAQKLISILYWSENIEGQLSMRRGLESELKKELINTDWKLETYVAGDGSTGIKKQFNQFIQAINKKSNLIIIQPTNSTYLSKALLLANEKNIPVIAYDQYIAGGKLEAFITSDNYSAGFSNGEIAHRAFPLKKKVNIVIVEYPLISSTTERLDGFLDALKISNRDFNIVKKYVAVEPLGAKNVAKKILEDFPKKNSIDLLFTANDGAGVTIVNELIREKRFEIKHVSIDGEKESIDHLKKGLITIGNSLQQCRELGKQTAKRAIDIINKKSVIHKTLVPTVSFDGKNVRDYKGWDAEYQTKNNSKLPYILSELVLKNINRKNPISQELKIGVDPVCPYLCKTQGKWNGYMYELLSNFAKEKNLKLTLIQIPSLRLTRSLEKKDVDLVLSSTGSIRFEKNFLTVSEALGINYSAMLFLKSHSTYVKDNILNQEDLSKFKIFIGPTSAIYLKDSLKEKNVNAHYILGEKSTERLIDLLNRTRADFIIEDYNILNHHLTKNERLSTDIQPTSLSGFNPIGLISLKNNQHSLEIAQLFHQWMQNYKSAGHLKNLIKKYNVEDWTLITR
ncbi:MAG: substrate-binding domain-containing protein [Bacteriovoracaceae bacterium]|nr:substrate-binding domain-containing protein [Bacteriovoracaceae bacterium]